MPSHLRLVVDESDDRKNGSTNAPEQILGCLENVSETEIREMWQECIKYPVDRLSDQYNRFMERHWRR